MQRLLLPAFLALTFCGPMVPHAAQAGGDGGVDADGAAPLGADPSAALVETAEGFFFPSVSSDEVIFYFPKLEERVSRETAAVPGVAAYRAGLYPKARTVKDPGLLREEWKGKTLRPYVITPASECTLARAPTLRFVRATMKAKGRDISGSNETAVCEFAFVISASNVDAEVAALEAKAAEGKLVGQSIALDVRLRHSIAWSTLRDSLARGFGEKGDLTLSEDEARAALGEAAAQSHDFGPYYAAASTEEKERFTSAAFAKLFVHEGGGVSLVPPGVTGSYGIVTEESHAL